MQITLCEDDGIFFEGVPRNVIIVVQFDDGKRVRLPYSAEKSISSLYEDLNNISSKVSDQPMMGLEQLRDRAVESVSTPKIKSFFESKTPLPAKVVVDKSNVIEKEDIVSLVMLDPGRDPGATCELVVGQEYRVVRVYSSGVTLPGRTDITQIVNGYDIVDDYGPRQERTRVFPNEVQLLRKRKAAIEKGESKIEEILYCTFCDTLNAMFLDGDVFKCNCSACSNDVEIKRIVKPCLTDKCGNDVALFDDGIKFRGSCNKCKAVMEVDHA